MRLIFLCFLLSNFFVYSQKVLVEYQFTNNSAGKSFSYNHYLINNDSESFFIMPYHKNFKNYEELLADVDYNSTDKYKASLTKKRNDTIIYGVDIIPKDPVRKLLKDFIAHRYKQISSEQKILGYNCKSAKIKFRGRSYTVWYTIEIPISDGPWKFFGLPGLILKTEDDDKLFTYIATRIVLNKDYEIPERVKNIYTDLSPALEYKEFIRLQNKVFNEFREKAIASLPKSVYMTGKTPPLRADLQEVSFEWENDSKKPK